MRFKVGDKVYVEKSFKTFKAQYIFKIIRKNIDKTYDIENELFIFRRVPEKYLGEKL